MLRSTEQPGNLRLPMIPIRDVVVFPYMLTPFVVGRPASVRALREALASDKKIFLATQRNARVDEPQPGEVHNIGTIANIVQSHPLPDGDIRLLVEGVERGQVVSVIEDEGYFQAVVKTFNRSVQGGPQIEILAGRVTTLFERYIRLSSNSNYGAVRIDQPGKLADTVCGNLQLSVDEKQELLEIVDPIDRLRRVAELLAIEIEKLPEQGGAIEGVDKRPQPLEDEMISDDPLKVYLREVQSLPPLTAEEEARCVQHIRAKDKEADWCGKTLVEANLHVVVTIAERHKNDRISILDLIIQGNEGMLAALETFAESNENSFPVHALPYIEQAIAQAASAES